MLSFCKSQVAFRLEREGEGGEGGLAKTRDGGQKGIVISIRH